MEPNGVGAGHTSKPRAFEAVMQDLSKRILNVRRPADFVAVLIYGVPFYSTIRIGIESGIFAHLAKGSILTADQIAELIENASTGEKLSSKFQVLGRRDFVVRNMRVICGLGLVDEPAPFTYQANELTLAMADPGLNVGISQVYHGVMGPRSTMNEMVNYDRQQGWRAPDTPMDRPYQRAHDIVGMCTFEHWVKCDPGQMSRLNASMQGMQANFTHWLSWFPKEALFPLGAHADPKEKVYMVDVGGGYGHDLTAFARQYPNEPIQMVLQELPGVLKEGEESRRQAGEVLDPRIQLSPHDFFQEQPVKGAQIYYMHKVMHDWPDKDCAVILVRLKDAMAPYFRILINDCILLNQGCPLRPAVAEIVMLAMHSGKERDEEMWTRSLAGVQGLSIRKFWHCPDDTGEGIVEIVRSDYPGA